MNGGYLVVLEGLGLNVSGKTTKGKAAYTILFQDLMEAVSAGGTCLFTTYASIPKKLIKNKNNFLLKLVNYLLPFLGGIVACLHNNTKMLNFNLKSILPYPYSIELVTGFKMNVGKFIKIGERGFNLERLINIRQGLKACDDTLPKRLTDELQRADDPESKVKLQIMLKDYYKIRGWDDDGIPIKNKLHKLGLD